MGIRHDLLFFEKKIPVAKDICLHEYVRNTKKCVFFQKCELCKIHEYWPRVSQMVKCKGINQEICKKLWHLKIQRFFT